MIDSLSRFFQKMNVQYRIYDMGRRIQALDPDIFFNVESQAMPYPAPYLRHAFLGLLFWDKDTPDCPLLWFIRLPLDEQGFLDANERDRFLQQLLIALGSNLQASQQGQQLAAVLENNPYVFTPTPERQAVMHARATQMLDLPPSSHYQATLDYLQGNHLDQWQTLALQGLAEVAIRWQLHKKLLLNTIPKLPTQPLLQLCHCLESETIDTPLTQVLCEQLARLPSAAIVRAISQSQAMLERQQTLQHLLENQPELETLAAIGSRCTLDLLHPSICQLFLQQLSLHSSDAFQSIVGDLLFDHRLRTPLLTQLRDEHQSDSLHEAAQALFLQQHTTKH